ncbi:hypothetical protein HPB49_013754 [Dermacentor silvarum]|uniref:Uncharacterized protein n=1 Tax=Dermacentor silvarum TaxID=543639 RepID=A0ACB8CL35_DERSI|nr:hypothetical protein HPB49_013754 [Dermacentor silvarum]
MSSAQDTTIGDSVTKPVACVGVSLLLLVGFVAYALVMRGDSLVKLRHCKGLTCADPYKALESILNHTVKPCDDMYAHVCSRWKGNREHAGFLQESLDNYLTKMHDIFETSDVNAVGEGLGDGLRTCANLFSQCLAAMNSKAFSLKEDVPYLMNKLLLTRVMESRTSREALQEGTEASFTFDLNGFLTLRPQRMNTAAVIYARTAAILSLDRIVVAGKRHAKSASKKILVKQVNDEPPILDALVARPIDRLARMSSLSKGYLLVRDYDNTMALIRIVEKAPRQDVSLYLVVQMLVDLLIFDHVAHSEANDKWQVLRACSGAVSRATSHVWSSLSRQLMLNKTSLDPVLELFNDVKATVTSDEGFLRNLLEDSTYHHLQKTLANVSFVSNRELLEQQRNLVLTSGSGLPTDKNFVRNYVAVRHQTRSQALMWPPSALWDIASISEMELRPIYNDDTNSLFLSTVLEIPHIFYSDDSARLLNYGTLGAALALRDNSTWKTMQKQFFLRFCLAACESSDDAVVNGRHKCIWPLADSRAFSKVFDCPDKSTSDAVQLHYKAAMDTTTDADDGHHRTYYLALFAFFAISTMLKTIQRHIRVPYTLVVFLVAAGCTALYAMTSKRIDFYYGSIGVQAITVFMPAFVVHTTQGINNYIFRRCHMEIVFFSLGTFGT